MNIRDEIKSIARQIKKIGDVDLHKKIFDIQAEISIVLEENKKLAEESNTLKEEIDKLKEKLKIMKSIRLEDSVYWVATGSKGEKEGPFCPNCWGTKEILVLMGMDIVRNRPYNKCPECMLVIRAKE
ncbi:MAG: hypothetical protein HY754_00530 [Nitrospirae bacterium]|nr:hypothetical protein [Nitrospirota bacterium]